MKEVWGIEQLIAKYQLELRQNVHKRQLNDYVQIGEDIYKDFERSWQTKFNNFEDKVKRTVSTKEYTLKTVREEKFSQGSHKYNQLRLKPSYKVRLLQNQEKLVAINERIEEAANYRNELKIIEKKDEERLSKLKNELINNLKKDLEREEKKEIKKVKDLLEVEKNKMLINKNKDTNILTKQINLHVNDIKRIQNQITNLYNDIAKKSDEMARTKERQRQTNKVLSTFKQVKSFQPSNSDNILKRELALALLNLGSKSIMLNVSMDSTIGSKESTIKKSSLALKYIIKNIRPTNFDINGDFANKKHVNVPEDNNFRNDNNLKKKIRKLLDQRKHQDEIFISPTAYYDGNLNLVCDAKDYRDLLPKLAAK